MSKRKPSAPAPAPSPSADVARDESPAAVGPERDGGGGGGGFWLRAVVAVALIAGAVWVGKSSARDARIEALLGHASIEGQIAQTSNLREVQYRQVLSMDPNHARATYVLAEFTVARDMRNLAMGRINLMDTNRFGEMRGMLERSLSVVDRQPGVHLLIGNISKMEARVHELNFQLDDADQAYRVTYDSFSESVRLLPRPRTGLAQLYGDLLYFATRSEDYSMAAKAAREQDWLGNRWFLVDSSYTLDSARSFEKLGLYPQALRELRYELRRQPGSREVIDEFARIASEGSLERVAIATFDDLEREGRLVPAAAQSRDRLRERIQVIPEGGLDAS